MFGTLWLLSVLFCAAMFPAMIVEEADRGRWRLAIMHTIAIGAFAVYIKYQDGSAYLLLATVAVLATMLAVRRRWDVPILTEVAEPAHLGIGATDAARIRNQ